jgi:two-component system, NtrC family, sensor kinase
MNSNVPKILIVDDVESNLVALKAVLEDMPCEIVVARSGNEALRLLLRQRFVAILLDVQMPEMDGYEVAHHARMHPETRDVPILFLTAKQETEDDILRGYGTGAVDYLFKPVSPVILRSKVRVFLELYEGRQKVEQTLKDLQSTQTQLVQSAKMASLGELVAGVAHEINNPLAFVSSHLRTVTAGLSAIRQPIELALETDPLGTWSKCLVRLQQMEGGLSRISDLVLQLRTFSRLDEGERKTVNMQECIDSVLMILGHRLGETIQVSVSLNGPEAIECYPGPLNLAILNLVGNAIDAIQGTGTIEINTRVDGEHFELRVVDDGPGIPDNIRERIFEPFFTTKPVGQGTGLGLSIGYSIAKKHGGELSANSSKGRTEMTLRFPLNLREGGG